MNLRLAQTSLAATALLIVAVLFLAGPARVSAGGGFFAARNRVITQPGQQVFITYDAAKHEESYTIQPQFKGDAVDFGVLYPIPSRPKLDEMPRDFFKALEVFTILKPLDNAKYPFIARGGFGGGSRGAPGGGFGGAVSGGGVLVLEAGIVGTLDYKIISAEKADDLFAWLKENDYAYGGDQATLDYYIQKKWVFVAMKIDGKQMTQRPDGAFEGQVTPTRFTFSSDELVYPVRMAQISVKDKTDILFYIQTADKVDLRGDFSYECTFVPMWLGALAAERGTLVTPEEFAWNQVIRPFDNEYARSATALRQAGKIPAVLMWAKRITADDVAMITGDKPFDRTATPSQVENLKLLKGYVAEGQFLTKMRKIFTKDELSEDLVFTAAEAKGKPDTIEYYATMPTTQQTMVDYSTPGPPPARGARRGNAQTNFPPLPAAPAYNAQSAATDSSRISPPPPPPPP